MTVVEVGPVTVRGPGAGSAATRVAATTAVDCIDDPIALIDDRLVAVEELWATVIADAAGPDAETLTLVCPTWWTVDQMARIRVAAAAWDSVVLHRVQALTVGLRKVRWAVVEIAAEVVMVSRVDADPVTVVRGDDAFVDAVLTAVGPADHVVIDAPAEEIGVHELGRAVSDRVRRRGGHVSSADLTALHNMLDHDEDPTGTIKDRGRTKLWLGAALLAASLCEWAATCISHRRPVATAEGVRLALRSAALDDGKARREFGYSSRPVKQALADFVSWFAAKDRSVAPALVKAGQPRHAAR